jgi:hypothetical protein
VTTTMQKYLLVAILVTLAAADLGAINQTVTITNSTSGSHTIYIGFNGASLGPYSQSDFPFLYVSSPGKSLCLLLHACLRKVAAYSAHQR